MIKLGETYKDGLDRDVRIICVDRQDDTPIVGLLMMGYREYLVGYTAGGQYIPDEPSANDLILPEDFRTYKIDEPIMVRDSDKGEWLRRYFAGVKADKPCAWDYGATSWSVSSPDHMPAWNQCRRPTKEELGK